MVCKHSTLLNGAVLPVCSPAESQRLVFGFRPLWLSPRQVMVVPVGPTCDEYAEKVNTDAIIEDRFSLQKP